MLTFYYKNSLNHCFLGLFSILSCANSIKELNNHDYYLLRRFAFLFEVISISDLLLIVDT